MAQRPIWRGQLRLALVSCPVALYSARHDRGSIHFNLINPETGNRIRMITQDAETKQELRRGDLVKGYEFKRDHFLIITDEDIDSVRVETSSTMMVEKFVEASSIDPIHYDASYYVAPDGKGADDVYAVLRQAVMQTGKVALARLVISQRERTVALRPMDGGLVAHTLNEDRDLNSAKPLFEDVRGAAADPEMVKLAVMLIDRQTGLYDPSDIEDRYETRLRAMLDAKLKGEGVHADADLPDTRDNVIDLMAALRKSLGESAPAAATTKQPPQTKAKQEKPRAARKAKAATPEELRRQPGFKLPIEGGRKAKAPAVTTKQHEPEAAPTRATRTSKRA